MSRTLSAPDRSQALIRLTGLLYLVIIICGIRSEGVVRATLIQADDAAATAQALRDNLGLFRLSLAADSVMALADIAVAALFLILLQPAGPLLAIMATGFRLVQAAVIGASLVLLAGVPAMLATGEDGLALHLAGMHATGYDIGLIFFGVNSLLMSVLLIRSGGVPRLLAYAVGVAGLVYLTGSYLRLLAPDLHAGFQIAYLIPLLSETALCLWLLIRARL